MTHKQVIIDGVDVSECKNLMQGIVPFGCMEDRKTCSCMNNPNCLYKQLQRKEQKCEKLKQILTEIKEHFDEECKLCKVNYVNITDEICEECKTKYILHKINEARK